MSQRCSGYIFRTGNTFHTKLERDLFFANYLFYSSYQNQMKTNVYISENDELSSPTNTTKIYIKKHKIKPSKRNSSFQIFTDDGFGVTAQVFCLELKVSLEKGQQLHKTPLLSLLSGNT